MDGWTKTDRSLQPELNERQRRFSMPLFLFLLWINTDREIFLGLFFQWGEGGCFPVLLCTEPRRNGRVVGYTLTRDFWSDYKMHCGGSRGSSHRDPLARHSDPWRTSGRGPRMESHGGFQKEQRRHRYCANIHCSPQLDLPRHHYIVCLLPTFLGLRIVVRITISSTLTRKSHRVSNRPVSIHIHVHLCTHSVPA